MQRFATSTGATWNGPICGTCGARYLGSHTCSRDDIVRRVQQLLGLLYANEVIAGDPTQGCPCRPENGGSGICGCVLGSPQITCSVVQ